MALPPGISAKTVTLGIASFADGSLASGRATISMPVNVVHTPSNRPIFSSDITASFVDGQVSFNLLPTDAPGLNNVSWAYKLRVEVTGATTQPDPIYFLLPTAGPDTVDLDGLVTVPSSAGVPISVDVLSKADFGPSLLTELNNSSSATSVALKAAYVAVVATNGVPSTARPAGSGSVYWIAPGGATNAQPQDIVYDPSAVDTGATPVTRVFIPATQMQFFYGATTYANTDTGTQATLLDPNTNTALIFTLDPARMAGWTTFNAYAITENDGTGTGVVRLNLTRMAAVANGGAMSQSGQIDAGDVSLTAGAQHVRKDVLLASGATVPATDSVFSWVLTRKATDALDTLANFIGIVGIAFVKAS